MKSWHKVLAEPDALPAEHVLIDAMVWVLDQLANRKVTREQQKAVEVAQHVLALAQRGQGQGFVDANRERCRLAFVAGGLTALAKEDERLEGAVAHGVAKQMFEVEP